MQTEAGNKQSPNPDLSGKVAIITGSARRIGSVTARRLHHCGACVVIHYGGSAEHATSLVAELNEISPESATPTATLVQADLADDGCANTITGKAMDTWGRLDILVNNASSFYPTPVGTIKGSDIDNLFATNFRAPLLLAQAAMPQLRQNFGSIVNMIDVHAYRPHPIHPVYCAAKSALLSATRSLALDLAPEIRVNGVAPGSILWPEGDAELSGDSKANILYGIPLQRNGTPEDIANLISFLVSEQANYITGQVIAVDGGRSL